MTRNGRRLLLAVLVLALAPGACATQESDSPDSPSATTTTTTPTRTFAAPVGDPPQQGRGTKIPVRWDPCVEIPDSTVSAAGFAPDTRERSDAINYDYAFIGCQFERQEDVRGQMLGTGLMFVSSANIGLEQIREREDEEEFTVNGRAGVFYRDRPAEACLVAFPGPDGVVHISVSSSIALTDWNACDHIDGIAGAIEPLVPK
ncbi:hypothetical protein BOX37_08560 [Nocardia mangyaensis]|uniref:DUF3558 domain-containing protein n=1 Tax=Nocardia mangyaensis TaxID=2213200 RepID=A0A1J0VPX3_9NOCA|nr:DUF3558 family protein [Nocardia mangyaensis]APE34015.1 hypothetical protein BOX37_08560 [Nocardia mangyaensis]